MKRLVSAVVVAACLGLVLILVVVPVFYHRRVPTETEAVYPLHTAAVHHPDRIDSLIRAGADINGLNGDGQTPLQLAATHHKAASVLRLLAAGASPNAVKEGTDAPVALAAQWADADVCKSLLEYGADPNGRYQGRTALHIAAIFGRAEIVKTLLAHGRVDVDAVEAGTGYTSLHDAVQHGRKDIIALLLDHGADVQRKDAVGNTPADLASAKADRRILASLGHSAE